MWEAIWQPEFVVFVCCGGRGDAGAGAVTAAGCGEGAIPAHPEGISRSSQLSQGDPRQCHPWVLQGWLAPCAPQAPARDPGGTLGAVSQRGRLARALPSPAFKPEGNHADPPTSAAPEPRPPCAPSLGIPSQGSAAAFDTGGWQRLG